MESEILYLGKKKVSEGCAKMCICRPEAISYHETSEFYSFNQAEILRDQQDQMYKIR